MNKAPVAPLIPRRAPPALASFANHPDVTSELPRRAGVSAVVAPRKKKPRDWLFSYSVTDDAGWIIASRTTRNDSAFSIYRIVVHLSTMLVFTPTGWLGIGSWFEIKIRFVFFIHKSKLLECCFIDKINKHDKCILIFESW